MISGEAINTKLIVIGLTRPGIEPSIYHTWDEQANHYTTEVAENPRWLLSYVRV
jgi:hypothetical protein